MSQTPEHLVSMRKQMTHLMPDKNRMRSFIKGETNIGSSPFWMLNFLKFKPEGQQKYEQYVEAITPLMAKAGGKPILLCNNVCNVIDGNGVFPEWDAIMIGTYASPQEFAKFSSSPEYAAVHHLRGEGLADTLMIASKQTKWAGEGYQTNTPKPDYTKEVPQLKKNKDQMTAIMGDPAKFMEFISNDKFEQGPVWMLNLLSFEEGNGPKMYAEYAARAQEDIN